MSLTNLVKHCEDLKYFKDIKNKAASLGIEEDKIVKILNLPDEDSFNNAIHILKDSLDATSNSLN